jgi:hypothetical protein
MKDIPFSFLSAADASDHFARKIFPIRIQYSMLKKDGLQTKVTDTK